MSQPLELVLKNGTCIVPDGPEKLAEAKVDIGVSAGRITQISENINTTPEMNVIDCTGLHVLPGLIDSQVHFREPGWEHKETIGNGTAGAVMGGITGVFEMPNTKPPTATALDLQNKIARAEETAWCNYAFYFGATEANAEQLVELENLPGCCGVKVFMGSSTGNLLVKDLDILEAVLKSGSRRVAVHCEDEARLVERKKIVLDDPGKVELHPVWRDEQTAFIATKNLLGLAEKFGRPVHVLHVTTAQEMEFLKARKSFCTVEVTPQHLTLSAPECYEKLGTLAQMNPPIRDVEHQEALWRGLHDGTVDVIGSDHAPHTLEEKNQEYPNTPSGMTGVQTTVPLMLNHINQGRLSLVRLVELMAKTPARIFKIKNKGSITIGNDADFTVVDMNAEKVITHQWIQSRSQWTPFHGMKVKGWPKATIISGRVVMRDDQILGAPAGKPIQFETNS